MIQLLYLNFHQLGFTQKHRAIHRTVFTSHSIHIAQYSHDCRLFFFARLAYFGACKCPKTVSFTLLHFRYYSLTAWIVSFYTIDTDLTMSTVHAETTVSDHHTISWNEYFSASPFASLAQFRAPSNICFLLLSSSCT